MPRPKRPQGDEEPPDEQRRSKLLPGGLREVGSKFLPAADSWQSLVDSSGQDGYSFLSFLRGAFPMLSFADLKTVETAFLLVKKDEMIQLNWPWPLCDDPENFEASQSVYYHATSALRAPSIRQSGLLPSPHGALCPTPALYCSPLRTTCLRSYQAPARFPIDKEFVMMFGVRGEKKGSFKAKSYNWQTWFSPGKYEVLFVQFLCTEGGQQLPEDVVADALRPGKVAREWRRRTRIVEELRLIRNSWTAEEQVRLRATPEASVLPRRASIAPDRIRQRRFPGTVKLSMLKMRKANRRKLQRLRRAGGVAGSAVPAEGNGATHRRAVGDQLDSGGSS